ncbi:MAG: chemotaxis protein CheW [Rubripirellula sp.]
MNTNLHQADKQFQICVFKVAGHSFGIDVQDVQEVLRYQQSTRVPLAPPIVCGMINLRGQVVMAIDLRLRLGFPERTTDQSAVNVVVRTPDGVVSLLVDELHDVLSVTDEMLDHPPDTMNAIERSFVTGCCKLNDRLLLILDTELVADISACVADYRTAEGETK